MFPIFSLYGFVIKQKYGQAIDRLKNEESGWIRFEI